MDEVEILSAVARVADMVGMGRVRERKQRPKGKMVYDFFFKTDIDVHLWFSIVMTTYLVWVKFSISKLAFQPSLHRPMK